MSMENLGHVLATACKGETKNTIKCRRVVVLKKTSRTASLKSRQYSAPLPLGALSGRLFVDMVG